TAAGALMEKATVDGVCMANASMLEMVNIKLNIFYTTHAGPVSRKGDKEFPLMEACDEYYIIYIAVLVIVQLVEVVMFLAELHHNVVSERRARLLRQRALMAQAIEEGSQGHIDFHSSTYLTDAKDPTLSTFSHFIEDGGLSLDTLDYNTLLCLFGIKDI
ncbi:hypothetical protein ACJX0J_032710, partial [Zea mays]